MKFPVTELPPELMQRTASFLHPLNAIDFSRTCKSVHDSVGLASLNPAISLIAGETVFNGDYSNGDQDVRWIRLPVPLNRRVHSVTLSLQWHDQGWGNRKSQVKIVSRPKTYPVDPNNPLRGGKVVTQSPIAEHHVTNCKLTFIPIEGHVYHISYKAGGGGGHALHLLSATLFSVIFDDPGRNISKNYRLLRRLGAIGPEMNDGGMRTHEGHFYHDVLMGASKSIRRQLAAGERPDPALALVMKNYSILVNEVSLLALEEIVQADIDERNLIRQERVETNENEADRAREVNGVGVVRENISRRNRFRRIG
jgi:hypothetical protein